jgi:hypothetical protein
MAYFQTKNPDLGKFWRLLQWKLFVYYTAVWSILRLFGIFCAHLVYFWPFGIFLAIWYILWPFGIFYVYLVYFSRFGKLGQEKSGNPNLVFVARNRFGKKY